MKTAAKTARVAPGSQGRILYAENDANVLASEAKIFEQAGFAVDRAEGRKSAEEALRANRYDAVILGHTLSKDDRHHLPYMAKKSNSYAAVMVLHASGKHPAVDYAMDSRDGHDAVLNALHSLVEQKALAAVS